MITDLKAIGHILAHTDVYPKPSFVRDSLATMGGDEGLIVVEGDQHKRQRRILVSLLFSSLLPSLLLINISLKPTQ